MSSAVFNGTAVKILKDILRSKTKGQILFSNVDPSVTATDASTGDLLISTTGALYIKKDNGSSTNWDTVIDDSSLASQLANYIPTSEKASALGVATLDAGGKVPSSQLPNSVMDYKGNWNASTNSPTLADGVGSAGDVYVTSVAGTQNLGSGSITFAVGDWVVYNGTIWEKSVNSNAVASVNGFTGAVVLDTDDISEGTALYFTDERAQDAVGSMVTNSSKVSLTYVDGTPSLTADIVSNSLVNADINSSAAIAYSKLNLSNSIVNADIAAAAAIVYSKLNLNNSLVTADYTADSVDNTKLSNMAQSTIKGRAVSAGTGDPTDLTATQATAILDTFVGDSGSGGTKGLVPAPASGDAAANKFLKADGTFAVPSGTGISQLTGDVTAGPGSGSQAATIANDAVTFAKIQNITSDRLVGRDTAASGDAEEISVTGGLEFTGSLSIQRSALTGDVTASAGSNATTIASDAVTNTKLANMATQTIKGRTTAGTGDPEDLTATQATAILNNFVGDSGSGGTKGLVPAPSSGDALAGKFLQADGTWKTLGTVPNSSITEWTSYTPTFTGFGTVSTQNSRWRRVGENLEVFCTFVPGTTTATIAQVSFPSGLTSASTIATLELAGTAAINVTSDGYASVLREASVSYFTFGRDTGSATALQKYNGNSWVLSGNTVSFHAVCPISGWNTGVGLALGWNTTATKTANYTPNANEFVPCDASGGAFTITLPTAVGMAGQTIGVLRTDLTLANVVTINTTSSQTIGSYGTSVNLATQDEVWVFVSNGSNWYVQQHKTALSWQSFTPSVVGFGTVSGMNARWRRDGEELIGEYRWINGTTTATQAQVPMPTGLTMSSTYNVMPLGYGGTDNGDQTFIPLSNASSNYFLVAKANSGNAVLASQNGNAFISSQTMAFFVRARITGWNA